MRYYAHRFGLFLLAVFTEQCEETCASLHPFLQQGQLEVRVPAGMLMCNAEELQLCVLAMV